MHTVIAQQMGVGLYRSEIVDCDDLNIGTTAFNDGAQYIAPDAAKAVNCYFYHCNSLEG